jgi:tetratricopeptide (TPR) repeat protein
MRRRATPLIAALLCGGVLATPLPEADQALVDSARLWEAQGRSDLAHNALEKLLRARPADPGSFLRIGLLELRSGRIEDAGAHLKQLRKDYPSAPETQELADAYRLATTDRLHLASVLRLVQLGQDDEAVKALHELFPDGPPHGETGIQYYGILGHRRQDWPQARAGLERLAREHEGEPQYLMALADLLSRHDETRPRALAIYAGLAQRQDLKPLEFMDAWGAAMHRASTGQGSDQMLRQYLARAPDDHKVAARLVARQRLRARLAELGLDTADTRVLLARADGLAAAQHWREAEELYRKILQLDPEESDAEDGLVRTLAGQGRSQEALDRLAAYGRSHPRRAAGIAGQRARMLHARADVETGAGQLDAARADLGAALLLAPDDPWVIYDLARLDAATDPGRGRALFAHGLELAPADPAMPYAYALYLSSIDAPQEALDLVSRIDPAQRTDGMRELYERMRKTLRQAEVEALADAGQWLEAHRAYAGLAAGDPADVELQLAYARFLDHGNDAASTDMVLDEVEARIGPGELDQRLEALRLRRSSGNWARAERDSAVLLAAAPDDPRVLRAAGQVAQGQGRTRQALDFYSRALAAAPADAEQRAALQELLASARRDAEDDARSRLSYVATAVDLQEKPGDAGVSQLRDLEIPLELRWSLDKDRYVWAHLDTVKLDSGTLPAVYNDAARYGKVQAYGPSALAQFPAGAQQSQAGESVAAGYRSDRCRFDLGTTPLGFLVQNVVGSAEIDGSAGPLDLSGGFSRRPVNSSYLSYGGARDPVTGAVWGGVLKNSFYAGAGHYEPRWGSNGSVAYSLLDGRNVRSNGELSARAAGYRILYSDDNTELSVGLSATYWNYQRNLRYYTFGQGGYYSPQSYLSIGIPVDVEGRWGRLAYQLRGSVSHSNSHESDSLFFPNDPALQAQAENEPLPKGYSRPVYKGGSGSGIGYDLHSVLEYKLTRRWFLGNRFEIDRSAFYEPNYYTLYLRYEFRPHDWRIDFPPRPIIPYSQY